MSLQYRKKSDGFFLVEPNDATDHGDSTASGSLAWCASNLPNGGTIEVVPGTYRFSQEALVPYDKVEIRGQTRGGTIFEIDSTASSYIISSSADHTHILNVAFKGYSYGISTYPVAYLQGNHTLLDNVRVYNTSGPGIQLTGDKNNLNNLLISDTGDTGLKIDGDYTTLRNSKIKDAVSNYLLHCTGDYLTIGNNHFIPSINSGTGMYFASSYSTIRGNHFIPTGINPKVIAMDGADYNLIAANHIWGYGSPGGTGIYMESACSENTSIGNIYRLLQYLAYVHTGSEYNSFVNDDDGSTSGVNDNGTGTWEKLL